MYSGAVGVLVIWLWLVMTGRGLRLEREVTDRDRQLLEKDKVIIRLEEQRDKALSEAEMYRKALQEALGLTRSVVRSDE